MHLLPEDALADLLRRLTKEQCHKLLSELVAALQTFSIQQADAEASGPIYQPLRTTITTGEGNSSLFMPSSNTEITAIKVVTVPKVGDIRGVINIFSSDGQLIGLLSAAEITAFRTALASVALLWGCKKMGKSRVAIFGAGKQAEWHARLTCLLFGDEVTDVTFVNRSAGRLDRLCDALSNDLKSTMPHLNIHKLTRERKTAEQYVDELKLLVTSADLLFCCTPSTEPLFSHAHLGITSKPKFISLIGSYKPHMQEIDTQTLLSGGSKVYVDSREACHHESGEIIKANLHKDQLVELGECDLNHSEIDVTSGENIVFKCVGMGIMDLVIAKTLLDIAEIEGIGSIVDDF